MKQHVGLVATDFIVNKENLSIVFYRQNKISSPHLNQMPLVTKRGMWIDEVLEA
jgi:hypothetical protein